MIVVLAGVSGSGKSTVGAVLAGELGWPFEDGDALHPAANIAKMRAGIPLTDADRWPWLATVGAWIDKRIAAGQSAVVACSALKRVYRRMLCDGRPAVRVVILRADEATLVSRLRARHGHFFPARLLASQLADLELPGPDERALSVAAIGGPSEVAAEIIRRLGLTPAAKRAAR
jgi:carbohydrate kinase (thermoresistant glucokinase family)